MYENYDSFPFLMGKNIGPIGIKEDYLVKNINSMRFPFGAVRFHPASIPLEKRSHCRPYLMALHPRDRSSQSGFRVVP